MLSAPLGFCQTLGKRMVEARTYRSVLPVQHAFQCSQALLGAQEAQPQARQVCRQTLPSKHVRQDASPRFQEEHG